MNSIPVNTSEMDMLAIEVLPKADQHGVQKRNADNVLVWVVRCLVSAPGGKPTVTDVNVPSPNAPELVPMSMVQFERLIARPWAQGDRSGVAFSAEQVRPSGKGARPAAPSTNGTKAPEPVGT